MNWNAIDCSKNNSEIEEGQIYGLYSTGQGHVRATSRFFDFT